LAEIFRTQLTIK